MNNSQFLARSYVAIATMSTAMFGRRCQDENCCIKTRWYTQKSIAAAILTDAFITLKCHWY